MKEELNQITQGELDSIFSNPMAKKCVVLSKGGPIPKTNKIVTLICSCYNFFSLSSVQILFIQACCLLCVL